RRRTGRAREMARRLGGARRTRAVDPRRDALRRRPGLRDAVGRAPRDRAPLPLKIVKIGVRPLFLKSGSEPIFRLDVQVAADLGGKMRPGKYCGETGSDPRK